MATPDFPQERWDKAMAHARKMLEVYKEFGPAGTIGANIIQVKISLYKLGYREEHLLEDLEAIE